MEKNGDDYHFISELEFKNLVNQSFLQNGKKFMDAITALQKIHR